MSQPPNQWRADGGYQQPSTPPAPEPAPNMFCYPYPQQMFQQHVNFVRGPVGIHGLFMPPWHQDININFEPRYQIAIPPPPPPPAPPERKKEDKKLPPKKEEEKKDGGKKTATKDEFKKEPPKKNRFAPPSLLPGTNYMFPMEHTQLHIFQRAVKVWQDQYKGIEL